MRNWQDITPVEPQELSNLFWYMTIEQFQTGIYELVRGGLVLPYGVFPSSRPGGIVPAVCTSWARWRSYEWNPPEFLPMDGVINASPKPLWQEIRRAYETAAPRLLAENLIRELKDECKRRITLAYEVDDTDDEIFLRLRGEHTLEQDAERVRIHAIYKALKTRIGSSTLEELEAIELTDDTIWVST